MAVDELSVEYVPVERLATYHRNPRKGDVGRIAESLRVNSQYRPIAVNRGTVTGRPNEVLAGNHTLLAARDVGWATIAATFVDVDDDQAARIVAVDNRSAELAEYDDRLLLELLADLPDLDGTGYDSGDLEALEKSLAAEELPLPGEGATDPDDVPDPPKDPHCQVGDVWELGPHRLVVGDSTDVNVHDALLSDGRPRMIYTDPPYGMSLQTDYTQVGHGQGRKHERVIGDDEPYDAGPVIAMYDDVAEQFWWGADYYRATLPAGGSWVVWDKRWNEQDMDLDKLFGAAFELCWSRQPHKRDIARVLWAMSHGTNAAGEDTGRGLHPTQKPTGLARWFFERWGEPGDIVADFYAGAGSTLIACDQAGRRARLVELAPRYADVICRRYQEHTGTRPTRSGEPHDFTTST